MHALFNAVCLYNACLNLFINLVIVFCIVIIHAMLFASVLCPCAI